MATPLPPFDAVILAAGKGSRMRTTRRKPLLDLAGKPMLAHSVASARDAGAQRIVCLIPRGMQGEFSEAAHDKQVIFVEQDEPTGTADAVALCLPQVREQLVISMFVDSPLITAHTWQQLAKIWRPGGFTLLNGIYPDPSGLGRIVRDLEGKIVAAVEEVEATPAQRSIKESWTGGLAGDASLLRALLPQIETLPNLKEKPLLGILPICAERGIVANAYVIPEDDIDQVANANDQMQLAHLEAIYRDRVVKKAMERGMQCAAPETLQVQGTLEVEGECHVGIGVRFVGDVRLGKDCVIGAWSTLEDCSVGEGSKIGVRCRVQGAQIGKNVSIGNTVRVRPHTKIGNGCVIQSGSELKAAKLDQGAVLQPGSVVLDAEIGEGVQFDTYATTANYDGKAKHLSRVGRRTRIDPKSVLIAPVTIGEGCRISGAQSRDYDINSAKDAGYDWHSGTHYGQPQDVLGNSTAEALSTDAKLTLGDACILHPQTIVIGEVVLGDKVEIGPECVLANCKIDSSCKIGGGNYISESTLDKKVHVDYGAQIINAHISDRTRVGCFAHFEDVGLDRVANIAAHSILNDVYASRKFSTSPFTVIRGLHYSAMRHAVAEIDANAHIVGEAAGMSGEWSLKHSLVHSRDYFEEVSLPARIVQGKLGQKSRWATGRGKGLNSAASIAEAMTKGLVCKNPEDCTIEGSFTFGNDVQIAGRFYARNVHLGSNVRIGAGVYLTNCTIGDDATIADGTVMSNSHYDGGGTLGVNAFIENSHLGKNVHVGFRTVVQNSTFGEGSKCGHSAVYVSAELGKNVNCGACSYTDVTASKDGKHLPIKVGDNAFIGVHCVLLPGCDIGEGSRIGACSKIDGPTKPGKLFVNRPRNT